MQKVIEAINDYQWEKKHHTYRRQPEVDVSVYRQEGMPDFMRTAKRLELALSLETPVLLPGELLAFTRTVPNLPMIFSEAEWENITSTHYIHEKGNVTNLSPGYGRVLATGLLALREQLTDSPYHTAMRISIDAVLALTARYQALAEAEGYTDLAETLAQVPAYPARTFREALQSLRILHYTMWCEGEYHNTLGRLDQYLYPYFAADIAEKRLTEEEAFTLLEAFFLSCNRDSDLYVGMQQGG